MSFIRTIEQFCAHVRVNVSGTDLENLAPDLRLVETTHLRPLLGPALYNELQALSDVVVEQLLDPASTDVRAELLRLVQGAVANLGIVEYTPLLQVQISDSGIRLAVDKTAFQWQINDLKASFRRKGFNALEEVLEYLDKNIDEPALAAWGTSAAAVVSHQYFLATARQFSEHYAIKDSRLTYLALLPTLRKVERFELAPVLGPALYAELKEQLKDRDLTEDNRELLEQYLRPALAHLVVAKALNSDLGLAFNGDAVELNMYRPDDANGKEADASFAQLLTMKAQGALADGHVYLTQLRHFLNTTASPTRFISYYNSAAYTAPTAARPKVENSVEKPSFRFF
ncbi:hypothetical protein JAO73_10470 [Hymenobacter sp. BT523]|uniref:DUF6712 family protein n=1 Tax=Hymenobacter sp. BT523 TaxID=2795725 RepID=UPI0018EDC109|nr:DUF6712 family protein [Hymenobacter sp. BT523]MBJ6109439.1 hypothetical protein [Hymenobacter sp. BT523]